MKFILEIRIGETIESSKDVARALAVVAMKLNERQYDLKVGDGGSVVDSGGTGAIGGWEITGEVLE